MVSATVPSQSKTSPRMCGGISRTYEEGEGASFTSLMGGWRLYGHPPAAGKPLWLWLSRVPDVFCAASVDLTSKTLAMKPTAEQFEKLALAQVDTLYRVANRLTRNPERSADLVQETFLRAFRSREGFDLQEHGMRPWLLRILRNLHLSRADREKRQPVAMDGEMLDSLNTSGASGGRGASGAEARMRLNPDDLDERLKTALENLQEEYQLVLLLWAVEELS